MFAYHKRRSRFDYRRDLARWCDWYLTSYIADWCQSCSAALANRLGVRMACISARSRAPYHISLLAMSGAPWRSCLLILFSKHGILWWWNHYRVAFPRVSSVTKSSLGGRILKTPANSLGDQAASSVESIIEPDTINGFCCRPRALCRDSGVE